jgi:uncharacterized protein (TIGR02466 family)
MKLLSLFPEPFIIKNIEEEVDLKEIENIKSIEKFKFVGENRTCYSEDTYILDSYPVLKEIVEKNINFFIQNVYGETNSTLKITQSWVNKQAINALHEKHIHTNSILSGTIYISVDENTGDLFLFKSTLNKRMMINSIDEYNDFTYDYYIFRPKIFDMYIFPSNLYHSVGENNSTIDRISLSFNTFYNCKLKLNSGEISELDLR